LTKFLVFGAIDKVAALFGATHPFHWLTIGAESKLIWPYEIDGRTYLLDILPPKRRPKRRPRPVPAVRRGTVTIGRTDMDVTVTEVTDPSVKLQALIACAAEKPLFELGTDEHSHLKGKSTLVALGLAEDDTPQGLAAALPHVAVFEITPSLGYGASRA
jgi:hypothetical protein